MALGCSSKTGGRGKQVSYDVFSFGFSRRVFKCCWLILIRGLITSLAVYLMNNAYLPISLPQRVELGLG